MEITLNGERFDLDTPCHAAELMMRLGLAERKIALEINGEIIARGNYEQTPIHNGDCVEIIHAVGGG